jgi:hypothetical protein
MKKNYIKKGGTFLLALMMLIAAASPGEVKASLTLKLYEGEMYNAPTAYSVKSTSSSKKSVASAKKINSKRVRITAKKAGKAKITIRTRGGTDNYYITVKKLKVTGTLTDLGEGKLLLTVKNATSQTFESVDLRYVLKDAEGTVIKRDTVTVKNVVAGKKVYKKIAYTGEAVPDLTQCSVKAVASKKDNFAKYKKAGEKDVTVEVTDRKNTEEGSIKYTVKVKNNLKKQFVKGTVYIFVYSNDEFGNQTLIDVQSTAFNLSAAKKKNFTLKNTFTGIDINSLTYTFSTVSYYYTY